MAHHYVADAMDSAARKVAQMLQNPDQLERVEQFRHQIMRRKASVDARLRTSVQSQLHDITSGLFLLKRARDDVLGIKSNIDDLETQNAACRALGSFAASTRVLAEERNELRTTIEQLDQIFSVPDILEMLTHKMDDDRVNMLEVHHELSKLERCREQILASTSTLPEAKAAEEAILDYFQPVSDFEKQFKQRMWFIARNPIDAVNSNPTLLVTILRIINREEQIDEKSPKSALRPKRWRKEYLDKVDSTIETRFDSELFKTSAVKFIAAFNGFFFQDLLVARDILPQCFPADYDIYRFLLNSYHNRLRIMVENLKNDPEIQPHEIMTLLNWMPVYNKQMKDTLGVDVETEFTQQLLDCSEDELRQSYLSMLSDKLVSWGANLITQEVKVWFKDYGPDDDFFIPNTTPDGKYYTETTVILFQMLDQQIEVAFQPGGGPEFAKELIRQCFNALNRYVTAYGEQLNQVRTKFFGSIRHSRPPALPEYMVASINGNVSAVKHVKDLVENRIGPHISEKEKNEYIGLFRPIVDIFRELALQGSTLLMDIVFSDLDDYFNVLFTPKWLRSKKEFQTIIVTLRDYTDDFKEHLNRSSLKDLMESIATRVLIQYVKAMMGKKLTLKSPEERDTFLDRLKEEHTALKKYLTDFNAGVPPSNTVPDMLKDSEILAKIYNIQVASKLDVNMCLLKLKQLFPDVTKEHLELILSFRLDANPKEVKEWMKKVMEQPPQESRENSEFFSYFPLS